MIWAATPGPLRIAPREMTGFPSVNFDDQIQFHGSSDRALKSWPISFEVVDYWRSLKPPATDLRVFVEITNSEGQTVAEQEHWPQGGLFPTSKWTSGDIIRERYILVLPGSLAAGKYQIWVGRLYHAGFIVLFVYT